MRYSLEKIAKELGVSKSTVSLILNGHASENRISAELEQTVKAFCKKVNYVPNIHARRAGARFAKERWPADQREPVKQTAATLFLIKIPVKLRAALLPPRQKRAFGLPFSFTAKIQMNLKFSAGCGTGKSTG